MEKLFSKLSDVSREKKVKQRRGGGQRDTITVLKKVPKYTWRGKCIRMWNDLIFPQL